MTESLLNLLLYIPVLVIALIVVPMYLKAGYRKGVFRALISVGATIVSVLAGIVVSRGLAKLISVAVINAVLSAIPSDAAQVVNMAKSLIEGVAQDIIALVLFGIVLCILLIVSKLIANRIKPDLDAPGTEKKSLKFAGLGIRLVDAVLVVFMLLVPLYGTLATYITPVSALVNMVQENASQQSNVAAYLQSISNHPMVRAYSDGPGSAVYGGLSGFSVEDAEIDLPDMMQAAEDTLVLFEKMYNADGEEKEQALLALTQHLKENVIQEEWSYALVCSVKNEIESTLDTIPNENTAATVRTFLDIVDMTREEFEANAMALVDFILYAMENEFMAFYRTSDYEVLSQDFLQRLGNLINFSDQAVALKRYITIDTVSELFFTYDYDAYNQTTYQQARNKASQDATAFVDLYWCDGYVPESQRIQEARSFMIMMFEPDKMDVLEILARHPLFGADVAGSFLTDNFLAQSLQFRMENAEQFLQETPEYRQLLLSRLEALETAPLYNQLFEDYFYSATSLVLFTEGGNSYYTTLRLDAEMLRTMLSVLDEDYFQNCNLAAGPELYVFLSTYEPSRSHSVSLGDLHTFLACAKTPAEWPSKISDEDENYQAFRYCLRSLLSNKLFLTSADALIATYGNDPMHLGANLSAAQKECLLQTLEELYNVMCWNPDASGSSSSLGSVTVIGPDGEESTITIDGSWGNISPDGSIIIGGSYSEEEIEQYNAQLEAAIATVKAFIGA